MRLIDADALMPNAEYKGAYDLVSAYDIKNAPTIDPVEHEQWILCDEQLPDKKGYYLTSDRFGVTITQWNGRGWVRTSVVTITEYGRSVHHEPPIIAWMPLPKPCKVDEVINEQE